jgi:predicted ArsR family transcriptional regulator
MNNDERSRLISENARLVQENAELKAKLAAHTEKLEHGLDPATWKVLNILFEATSPLTVQQIAIRCDIPPNEVEHQLAILKVKSLISTRNLPPKESGAPETVAYLISPIGSGFITKHKKSRTD